MIVYTKFKASVLFVIFIFVLENNLDYRRQYHVAK
jgi:hypothetical protein